MKYIKLFENKSKLYKAFKKESPLKTGEAEGVIRNKPIEGGVLLILSRPFDDLNRRLYMAVINHVREDNETKTLRVDVVDQFSILKLYPDGNVYPEKVTMDIYKRDKILGMLTTGIYANKNKTPLWYISAGLRKPAFFDNPDHQKMLLELPEQYKNLIYPVTTQKQKPNLHL